MAPTEKTTVTTSVDRAGKTDDQQNPTVIGRRNQPTAITIDLISDSENDEDTKDRKTNEVPKSDTTLKTMNPQDANSLQQQLRQANQKMQRLIVRDQQLNQALAQSNSAYQQLSRDWQHLTQQNQYLSSRALQLSQELQRGQKPGNDPDKVEIERLKGELRQQKIESQQLKQENLILKEKNQQGKSDYQKLADREAELVQAMRTKFGVPQSTLNRLNEITQELRRNEAESKKRELVLRARAAQADKEFERNREGNAQKFIFDFGHSFAQSFQK